MDVDVPERQCRHAAACMEKRLYMMCGPMREDCLSQPESSHKCKESVVDWNYLFLSTCLDMNRHPPSSATEAAAALMQQVVSLPANNHLQAQQPL